jgi:hypothetical protein
MPDLYLLPVLLAAYFLPPAIDGIITRDNRTVAARGFAYNRCKMLVTDGNLTEQAATEVR